MNFFYGWDTQKLALRRLSIMCLLAGSFLTYASLEEKTAPGQININEMREIYHLFPNFL